MREYKILHNPSAGEESPRHGFPHYVLKLAMKFDSEFCNTRHVCIW